MCIVHIIIWLIVSLDGRYYTFTLFNNNSTYMQREVGEVCITFVEKKRHLALDIALLLLHLVPCDFS